jgi:hypothetical protein
MPRRRKKSGEKRLTSLEILALLGDQDKYMKDQGKNIIVNADKIGDPLKGCGKCGCPIDLREMEKCPECNINMIDVIGDTQSSYGAVYKITFGNSDKPKKAALKILPHEYFGRTGRINAYESNENEIKITNKLSELVMKGKCDCFPILYYGYECNDKHVMISELAWGDLSVYIRKYLLEGSFDYKLSILINILIKIVKSIKIMQEHNIIHNDLSIGNVLVKEDPTDRPLKAVFLIHDFGRAKESSDENIKVNMKLDILYFISTLWYYLFQNKQEDMTGELDKINDYIDTVGVDDLDKIIIYLEEMKSSIGVRASYGRKKSKRKKTKKSKRKKTKKSKRKKTKKSKRQKKKKSKRKKTKKSKRQKKKSKKED